MRFTDNFFKKVEKKTSVDKDTILSLAEDLKGDNKKNESSLRDVIRKISDLTGKKVPTEKEDKIIETILDDNVPENIEDMID